uniref:Pyrophosphatefructose 6-phosphate 1-phosphotransferase subunit beta n=1 Tax=Rhizophora mucronata TaxID=61149 RepID=A0A2P2J1L3_RHIMU
MKFWPMMWLMKMEYGKKNSQINLWSFLNFYRKQFRNSCFLREIRMEMSRLPK